MIYLESHINIATGNGADMTKVAQLAKDGRMKISMMDNHDHLGDPATKEWVVTGHSRDRDDLEARMRTFISLAKEDAHARITRYKIEEALLDSRVVDEWNVLS